MGAAIFPSVERTQKEDSKAHTHGLLTPPPPPTPKKHVLELFV